MNILNENAHGATNIQQALATASMDWTVSKESLYTAGGEPIPGTFGTFRSDKTGANAFLGAVGNQYEVMQNEVALGDTLDSMVQASGGFVSYASIGELRGGRQVYASLDLGSMEVVPGDELKKYLVSTTSHDGSTATQIFLSTIRPICQNTLNAGAKQGRATGEFKAIKHTATSHDRLALAMKELKKHEGTAREMLLKLKSLATRQLDKNSVQTILERLFPTPKVKEGAASTRTENKRAQFLELFELNDGANGIPSIKGTAYNALNAFTEYTDHYAVAKQTEGKKEQSIEEIRAENAVFGMGAIQKANALEMILEVTKYAPTREQPQTFYAAPANNSVLLDSILSRN